MEVAPPCKLLTLTHSKTKNNESSIYTTFNTFKEQAQHHVNMLTCYLKIQTKYKAAKTFGTHYGPPAPEELLSKNTKET